MILQPCSNVELTKVYYYDQSKRSHNMSIPTISRETHQNSFNKNMMIKKNIFGHKWVLKINEQEDDPKKKKHRKLTMFAYTLVFFSIILAMCFGIFFSLDYNIFRPENKNTPNHNNNDSSTLPNRTNLLDRIRKTFITDKQNIITNKSHPIMIDHRNRGDNLDIDQLFMANTTMETQKGFSDTSKPYCFNCSMDEVCIKMQETEKPRCTQMNDIKDPTGCGGLCRINTEYCKNLDKTFHVYQCLKLKSLLKCPEETFNCGNMCVPLSKRCDGRIDCSNMMDEKNCECNLNTHFQCGNQTSCLDNVRFCDGKVDCWDKSDELNCQKGRYCGENYIPCLSGQCIPKEKMCDKVFDCTDKSDEPFWCQLIKH